MSVSTQITRIKTNIANTYTALKTKGATIPSSQTSANLKSTVESLSSATVSYDSSTKTLTITTG